MGTLTKAKMATLSIPTLPSLEDIASAISLAHQSHGDSVDGKTITTEAMLLKNEMQNRGYRLEKKELHTALLNGAFGKYGEVFRVCPTEMIKWVQAFVFDKAQTAQAEREKRQAEERTAKAQQDEEDAKRRAEEFRKETKTVTNQCYLYFRQNGSLPNMSFIQTRRIYNYLVETGKLEKKELPRADMALTPAVLYLVGSDEKTDKVQTAIRIRESERMDYAHTATLNLYINEITELFTKTANNGK